MSLPMIVSASGHFHWNADTSSHSANFTIQRYMFPTIGVSCSVAGSYIGYELTPKQAREAAAALLLAADTVDAYLAEQDSK